MSKSKWKVGLNGLSGQKRFKYILGAKLGFVTFVSHDVSMSKKWHELL